MCIITLDLTGRYTLPHSHILNIIWFSLEMSLAVPILGVMNQPLLVLL
jgi:hypothetical protein